MVSKGKRSDWLQHKEVWTTELRIWQLLSFPREAFVFVVEMGSDARNYIRKFGYSLQGLRAESHCRLSRGHRISAIAAMDCTGIVELELIIGSVILISSLTL